jgi:hypothetical protein
VYGNAGNFSPPLGFVCLKPTWPPCVCEREKGSLLVFTAASCNRFLSSLDFHSLIKRSRGGNKRRRGISRVIWHQLWLLFRTDSTPRQSRRAQMGLRKKITSINSHCGGAQNLNSKSRSRIGSLHLRTGYICSKVSRCKLRISFVANADLYFLCFFLLYHHLKGLVTLLT